MAAVIGHSDFGAQEHKICHCSHFSPSICHERMGSDAMNFSNGDFQAVFSTLFFPLPQEALQQHLDAPASGKQQCPGDKRVVVNLIFP